MAATVTVAPRSHLKLDGLRRFLGRVELFVDAVWVFQDRLFGHLDPKRTINKQGRRAQVIRESGAAPYTTEPTQRWMMSLTERREVDAV